MYVRGVVHTGSALPRNALERMLLNGGSVGKRTALSCPGLVVYEQVRCVMQCVPAPPSGRRVDAETQPPFTCTGTQRAAHPV